MAHTTIITNGHVLTCDTKNRSGRLTLVIDDGKIREVSERGESILRENPHAIVIDASGKLVLPGFVNAHFHGLSFLLSEATRGMHFSLWDSTQRYTNSTMKLLHETSRDDLHKAYRAAYHAMLHSGVTTVGEFPPPVDEDGFRELLRGIESSGVRAIIALQNWEQIRAAQTLASKRMRGAVALGKESDFTVYTFDHLSKAAKDLRAPLLAHIAETRDDVEVIRQNFQRDAVTLLSSFNLLHPTTICVHVNHITDEEVKILKAAGNIVVVSPQSTARKQTGYPAIRHLAKHHVPLSLGTDWGQVGMLEEMRFLHQLPMLVPGLRNFPSMEIIRMATINGAAALGVHHETGSLEPGKDADCVFLDVSTFRVPVTSPFADAEAWARVVVESLSSSDIVDVMMKGEICVQNRKLIVDDETRLLDEFRELHNKYFRQQAGEPDVKPSPTANVIPFVPERSMQQQEAGDDYVSGFPAPATSASILDINDDAENQEPPLRPGEKPMREPIKPELPKNTRRVFGDDDDV